MTKHTNGKPCKHEWKEHFEIIQVTDFSDLKDSLKKQLKCTKCGVVMQHS